jgi:hypothetical protein
MMPAFLIRCMREGPLRIIVFPKDAENAAEWNKLRYSELDHYKRDGVRVDVIYATGPGEILQLRGFASLNRLQFRHANDEELALDSQEKYEAATGTPVGAYSVHGGPWSAFADQVQTDEERRAEKVALGEAWLENPGPAMISYTHWFTNGIWMFESLRCSQENFRSELGVTRVYGRFKSPSEVESALRRGVMLPDIEDVASLQYVVCDEDAKRRLFLALRDNLIKNNLPCGMERPRVRDGWGDRILTRVGDLPYEWHIITEHEQQRFLRPQPLEEMSTSSGS